MKAMTKIKIPTNAKTSAATMLPSGTRFILLASCVMVIEAINRTVGPRIIADGLRNILEFVDGVEAPAAILAKSGGAENQESVQKIEFSKHYSSSPVSLDNCMGGGSLSDQRHRSKVKARKEMMTTGTTK